MNNDCNEVPMSRTCLYGLMAVLVSWPGIATGELVVSTNFPGGNAEVRRLDETSRILEISPVCQPGRGWPCWWYLRIDGATPGATLTVEVRPSDKPFRHSQILAANWALPERAAISTDDVHWKQTEPGKIRANGASYEITVPASRFWLAWGPPFLPSHAEALIADCVKKIPGARRFVLARTREGREVPGVRIGNDDARQAIWIQARQHAWESGGSWVGQGALEWLISDDPAAVQLRGSSEIICVPIMDVDNVTRGAGGKEAEPRDHNRDWSDSPVYPEVAAAEQEIRSLVAAGRLRTFVDLHNPGPGNKQPYFYGQFDYQQLTPERRERYDRFLELAVQQIRGPLPITPKYQFATYVQTEEERNRMSGTWVRNHGRENVIALTLETAWNTPHSTAEGYRTVGAGLARAIAIFLAD
jgi:hypothetical protein